MAPTVPLAHVPARDGYRLGASVWDTPKAKRVVLVNSATAVPRRYYQAFADALAADGAAVVTYDYRGIGDSRPPTLRGFAATASDWGHTDLAGVIDWAHQKWPDLPLDFVGHSIGGQLLGFAPNVGLIRAAALIAAQSGDWRLWPAPVKWRRFDDFHLLIPGAVAIAGYVPGKLGMGEDLPGGVASEWAGWCRQPGYFFGGAGGAARREEFGKLRLPILSVSIEDDTYAPPSTVAVLEAAFTGAQVTGLRLAPSDASLSSLGHFGFFRSSAKSLWSRVLTWFNAQAP